MTERTRDGGEGQRPSIVVRAVEPRDVEELTALFSCPGVVAGTLQMPFVSVEARRARVGATDPQLHALVAVVGGVVVGSLTLHVQSRPRRRHAGEFGIAVHDDYQGQGVASALMDAMIDLADNWIDLRRIELTVFADNAAAVHLYQKYGFAIEGTAKDYAFRAGDYLDAYMMARLKPR